MLFFGMPFVKLDCAILDSTLWEDRDARDVFLTAILMSEPINIEQPMPELEITCDKETGWILSPGWYGFVPTSGRGLARRAMLPVESGLAALSRLRSPDPESRTPDYNGRRMVRVAGGFIILNFMRYREKDYGAARRMKLYRERAKQRKAENTEENSTPLHRNTVTQRNTVTEAEAEAYASTHLRGGELPLEGEANSVSKEEILLKLLEANPKFKHVNIREEWDKNREWCRSHGLTQTNDGFFKWVSRIRPPRESTPSSFDDCLKYALEIKMPRQRVEVFYDHFTSNGWKVGGKAPMKDWKAAMRNFHRNGTNQPARPRSVQPMRSGTGNL